MTGMTTGKETETMKYAYKNGIILDGSQDMEPVSGNIILTVCR